MGALHLMMAARGDNAMMTTQQTRLVSIDNGNTFHSSLAGAAGIVVLGCFEQLVERMDDETRERVHAELAPCSEEEFLARYLELAPCDLVIG